MARESEEGGRQSRGHRHRLRRTWPQRFGILATSATSLGCFGAATTVWYANHSLGKLQRVEIVHASPADLDPTGTSLSPNTTNGGATTTTEAPLPVVDLKAQNYLLVGSDSRGCVKPDSPYYGGLYAGEDTGTNSDTIMLIRADPTASQAAILSFPRDLFVRLADSNAKGRINSVFQGENPSRLVRTIELNFQLKVDHYINVDFCAFKDIVDAVGGVAVPFASPVRDLHTGLEILEPGCHTFEGDEALAYTRSRYYEAYNGRSWVSDMTSDYGRIARQQDFVKRTIAKAIDRGVTRPAVAQRLLNAVLGRVKVDLDLTPNDMLTLASKLKGFDPASIRTYRVEGPFSSDGGVILYDPNSATNKGILKVFRGQARLQDAPDPTEFSEPTVPAKTTTTLPERTTSTTTFSGSGAYTTTTTIVIDVKENDVGFAPPKDLTCR